MADANRNRFNQRINVLKKKTEPGVRVERRVQEDGLVVDVARTKTTSRSLLPIKGFIIAIAIFMGFKSFLLAEIGEMEYLQRVDDMKQGSAIEVSAAFLLDVDPVTQAIASVLTKALS
ncbi:MAG: hypothetical protein AAF340_11480 [Pseudomonadota bacterium]